MHVHRTLVALPKATLVTNSVPNQAKGNQQYVALTAPRLEKPSGRSLSSELMVLSHGLATSLCDMSYYTRNSSAEPMYNRCDVSPIISTGPNNKRRGVSSMLKRKSRRFVIVRRQKKYAHLLFH